jgi:hypothetical protein
MRKLRRDLPSAPKMYRTGISGFELGLAHHYASVVPDTTSLPQNNYTLLFENREEQQEIAAVFRKQGVPGSHPVPAAQFLCRASVMPRRRSSGTSPKQKGECISHPPFLAA